MRLTNGDGKGRTRGGGRARERAKSFRLDFVLHKSAIFITQKSVRKNGNKRGDGTISPEPGSGARITRAECLCVDE